MAPMSENAGALYEIIKMAERSSTLVHIKPADIAPNRDNPRALFDYRNLKYLSESISDVGVLVPLIVYEGGVAGKKYTLLDGERRLRCARDLKLETVPANIIDPPSKLQNILLMFNIHNVRKDWELVPTALKLEAIIRLQQKSDISNRELARLTGMSSVRVSECKRILEFDKKYLDLALEPDPRKRIRGDFFSQLALPLAQINNFPEIVNEYRKDQIIDRMIAKYREGTIVNPVNEFRMLKKILISAKKGVKKEIIVTSVKEFLESEPKTDDGGEVIKKAMTMKELFEMTSHVVYREEDMVKKSNELAKMLGLFDVKTASRSQNLIEALNRLSASVNKVLSLV